MGDHLDNMGNALPVHTVELEAFYMDIYEVTVGQFKRFAEESGYAYNRWNDVAKYSPTDEHPMIYVSWNDATAYVQWAGKRLPTEAEWEYATRGGLDGKRYPWGDDESVARDHANYSGTGGKDQWEGPPTGGTAPVGSFDSNGYGLYDVAGNVWEWCSDWYGENYYTNSPLKNPKGPKGPDTGQFWVLRGGAWNNLTKHLRAAYRLNNYPTTRRYDSGFRCVSGLN
jgi:formylglycine-generating enzyme required for sulfatase activity